MTTHRPLIAALQVTLDGYTQDTEGRSDWVDSWADGLELLPPVDAFVLGGGMFPQYEQFWTTILDDPAAAAELLGREPYPREIAYARRAAETPHLVLSRSLAASSWPSARIVDDIGELAALRRPPGKAVYVVGGPTLVAGLMDAGLLDELRLIVHPVALRSGAPVFARLAQPQALELVAAAPMAAGRVNLTYRPVHHARLLLGTTGARSGRPRTTPLAYRREGERVYVIASNGGAPADPAWYLNLRANPSVTVDIEDERFDATATVLEGANRERVFAAIAEESPAAGEYQASTGRTIPVVALDRRS